MDNDAAGKASPAEIIVPGPTDQNESEAAAARSLFQAVTDRAPLSKIEMPAYWRCLKWARAQSFADLERRAVHGVVYTQLWEQPDKYRGKLVRLRLHIRRILDWEAPENSAGVRRVYEAWGWTDESKSFPYVVVFSDLPEGIPLGDNVEEEGLFVGYFLKTIAYTAFNRNRSSPLLLGRMKWLASAGPGPSAGRPQRLVLDRGRRGFRCCFSSPSARGSRCAASAASSFRPRRRPTRRKWRTGSATGPPLRRRTTLRTTVQRVVLRALRQRDESLVLNDGFRHGAATRGGESLEIRRFARNRPGALRRRRLLQQARQPRLGARGDVLMDQVVGGRLVQFFDGQPESGLGGGGVIARGRSPALLEHRPQGGSVRPVSFTANFGLAHRLFGAG